jgi:hypothetical protein
LAHKRLNKPCHPGRKAHFSTTGINQQANARMTKKMILATSMMLLSAMFGPALAYSNVAQKAPHEAVSAQQASNAFDVFDQMTGPRATGPNSYRYHGGPKSND